MRIQAIFLIILARMIVAEIAMVKTRGINNPGIMFSKQGKVHFIEQEWNLLTTVPMDPTTSVSFKAQRLLKEMASKSSNTDRNWMAVLEGKIDALDMLKVSFKNVDKYCLPASEFFKEDTTSTFELLKELQNTDKQTQEQKLSLLKKQTYIGNKIADDTLTLSRGRLVLERQIEYVMENNLTDTESSRNVIRAAINLVNIELKVATKILEIVKRQSTVLTTDYLLDAKTRINNTISSKFPILQNDTIVSDFNKLAEMKILKAGNLLIINFKFPLISQMEYDLYSMTALPVFGPSEIENAAVAVKPRSEYLAVSKDGEESLFLTTKDFQKCIKTQDRMLCTRSMGTHTDRPCETELLLAPKDETYKNCTIEGRINSDIYIIATANTNEWFFSTATPLDTRTKCNDEERHLSLQGAGILEVPAGCRITIKHETFYGTDRLLRESQVYYIPAMQLVTPYTLNTIMMPTNQNVDVKINFLRQLDAVWVLISGFILYTVIILIGTALAVIMGLTYRNRSANIEEAENAEEVNSTTNVSNNVPEITWEFAKAVNKIIDERRAAERLGALLYTTPTSPPHNVLRPMSPTSSETPREPLYIQMRGNDECGMYKATGAIYQNI